VSDPVRDAESCRKCGGEIRGEACGRCGLRKGAMASWVARNDEEASPSAVAGWAKVQQHWTDDAAHEAFMAVIASDRAFAWASRQYRAAAGEREGDPRPAAMQARLTKMAEAVVFSSASRKPPERRPYRAALLVLLIGALLLGAGAIYAKMSSATAPRAPRGTGGPSLLVPEAEPRPPRR